jgi:hypothetical protein
MGGGTYPTLQLLHLLSVVRPKAVHVDYLVVSDTKDGKIPVVPNVHWEEQIIVGGWVW